MIIVLNIFFTLIALSIRKMRLIGYMTYLGLFVMYYVTMSLYVFHFGDDMPFGFWRYVKDDVLISGVLVIAVSCLFYDIGYNLDKIAIKYNGYRKFTVNVVRDVLLGCVSVLPFIFLIGAYDYEYFIERSYYRDYSNSLEYEKYADIFAYISMFLTPLIYNVFVRRIVFIMIFFVFIAIGSRMAILYAMIYVLVRLGVNVDSDERSRRKYFFYLFLVLLSGVNIYIMRFGEMHGFLGFFRSIGYYGFSLFYEIFKFLNFTINCSVIIIGRYVVSPDVNYHLFWNSINPLPGFMLDTNSGDIDAWARFRKNIPHSALSQIYVHMGIVFSSIMFFFIGKINKKILLLFSCCQNRVCYVDRILYNIILFVGGVPLLVGLQFNLRTISRLYYILWFVAIVVWFVIKIRQLLSKKNLYRTQLKQAHSEAKAID